MFALMPHNLSYGARLRRKSLSLTRCDVLEKGPQRYGEDGVAYDAAPRRTPPGPVSNEKYVQDDIQGTDPDLH